MHDLNVPTTPVQYRYDGKSLNHIAKIIKAQTKKCAPAKTQNVRLTHPIYILISSQKATLIKRAINYFRW